MWLRWRRLTRGASDEAIATEQMNCNRLLETSSANLVERIDGADWHAVKEPLDTVRSHTGQTVKAMLVNVTLDAANFASCGLRWRSSWRAAWLRAASWLTWAHATPNSP